MNTIWRFFLLVSLNGLLGIAFANGVSVKKEQSLTLSKSCWVFESAQNNVFKDKAYENKASRDNCIQLDGRSDGEQKSGLSPQRIEGLVKSNLQQFEINTTQVTSVTAISSDAWTKIITPCVVVLEHWSSQRLVSRMKAHWKVTDCDGKQKSFSQWFRLTATKQAFIADQDLDKFSDVNVESFSPVTVNAFGRDYLNAISVLKSDRRTLRAIKKGTPVLVNDIVTIDDVTIGDEVKVILADQSFLIETKAVALNSGSKGDKVNVELIQQKKVLSVRVMNKGITHYE